MPFCTQCGKQVGDADVFCAVCGNPQRPVPSGSGPAFAAAGIGGFVQQIVDDAKASASRGFAAGTPPPSSSSTGSSAPPPFPPPGAHRKPKEVFEGWEDSKVAAMSYIPVAGWIFGIIALASDRFRHSREVRFHAFQGLYLFVLWLVMNWVFEPIARHNGTTRHLADLVQMFLIGVGIFMLVKTRQGEFIRLPVIGELAEKSVSEQK